MVARRRVKGLVSVVVTSWNRKKYILECLNSLARQTYPNVEIIVVDDASTDGTVQLVNQWKTRLPASKRARVWVVRLPRNSGYSAALTTGMFLARGEWIATQDSDDYSHPRRFERQVQYLTRHPRVGLVGTNYRIVRGGRVDERIRPNWLAFGVGNIRRRYANGSHCITCGSLMFKGALFDQLGGLNRRMNGAEDYEFVQRFYRRGIPMENLREVLYYVRSHPGQRSREFYGKRK